jgi:hypothetical protein
LGEKKMDEETDGTNGEGTDEELPIATHFLYALEDSGSLYGPPTVKAPLRLIPSTLYPRSMTTPEFLARLAKDGVVTPVALTDGDPILARV